MQLIINSRKLNREFRFVMGDTGGYIRLSVGGYYQRICRGGGFMGSNITSTPEDFVRNCRNWYRAHVATEMA